MAHIPDGVLAAPVVAGGAVLAGGLLAVSLRRLAYDRIPQAAVLAAAFFVASLIHLPVGPGSVHPLLNGLMGLILGWAAVPAIVVALVLQLAFFGYGGLLVLGVNTFNLAAPALVCALLLTPLVRRHGTRRRVTAGALAGALGVVLTGVLVALTLGLSDAAFAPAARLVLLTYLPLTVVEAALTGAAVAFLHRVSPELLMPSEPGGG